MKQNLYIMKEGVVLLLSINKGRYGDYGHCLFHEEIRKYRLGGNAKGSRVILDSDIRNDSYFGDVFLTPL